MRADLSRRGIYPVHFATTYASDFIAVQGRRTSTTRDWRSVLSTELPERFFAFGQAIIAPAAGRVISVHDGEADHEARRSQLALLPYMLTQAGRARAGAAGPAGNHMVLELEDGRGCLVLAHLRTGSLRVRTGERVVVGQVVAECGNSGNSTQPHLLNPGDGRHRPVSRSGTTDALPELPAVAAWGWAAGGGRAGTAR